MLVEIVDKEENRIPIIVTNTDKKGLLLNIELSRDKLEAAKKLHDTVLAKQGPYGTFHRCNDRPFEKDMLRTIFYETDPDKIKFILDRDTLYSFSSAEQKNRKALGRQKWINPIYRAKSQIRNFNISLAKQSDLLCSGKQIRVSV